MKRKISSLSRLSGIILGTVLVFVMCTVAIISVITNEDFWLKQNDRYKHQETLSLVSSDDYSTLYHNYILMLQGEQKSFTVTVKGDPQDYTDTFKTLGSIQPSEGEIHYENSVTLDDKYLETVTNIENTKYSKTELDNKFYIELSCPLADAEFSGVNIKNMKVTDGENEEIALSFKKISILKDGSIKTEKLEESENILFTPQSNSTLLRAYLSKGDIKDINISFDASAVKESTEISVKLSYEEELTAQGVADMVGPEKEIVTEDEAQQLVNAGKVNDALKITAVVLFILAVALVVYTVKKQGRKSFYGIGVYTVIMSFAFILIVNLLVYFVPSQWGFDLMFSFPEGSTSNILMGEGFMNDFAAGTVRFFDFIMLAPLFVGYVMTKLAKKKNYDPNEDYMYQ